MKDRKLIYIAAATAAVYLILILWWHLRMPVGDLTVQNPGADNRPAGLERKADDVVVGEYFMSYKEDFQTELQGKWIGFRGEDHTNIIKTADGKPFLEGEFEQVWSFETGEGHAAPVIYNGRVYVLDYN